MIICWGLYIHQIWVLKQNGCCEAPYLKLWLNNIYNFESYPSFSSVEVKMSSQRLSYIVSRHQQYLCQQFQNAIYSCGDFSCISLWQSWFYHHSQHPSSHQVKGHSFITWLLAVLHRLTLATSAPILPVYTDIRGAAASLVHKSAGYLINCRDISRLQWLFYNIIIMQWNNSFYNWATRHQRVTAV